MNLLTNVEVSVNWLSETRCSASYETIKYILSVLRKLSMPLRSFVMLHKWSTPEEQLNLCCLQCFIVFFSFIAVFAVCSFFVWEWTECDPRILSRNIRQHHALYGYSCLLLTRIQAYVFHRDAVTLLLLVFVHFYVYEIDILEEVNDVQNNLQILGMGFEKSVIKIRSL